MKNFTILFLMLLRLSILTADAQYCMLPGRKIYSPEREYPFPKVGKSLSFLLASR